MLVVNMDVVDRHEESAVAAPRVLQLCQMVSEANADASLALCTCNKAQLLKLHSVRRLWAVSYIYKSSEISKELSAMHDRPSTKCTEIASMPYVCPYRPCSSYRISQWSSSLMHEAANMHSAGAHQV